MTRAHGWRDRFAASPRTIRAARFVSGIARIAALVVFALVINVMGFRPASRSDSYLDVTAQLANTIRAANDGYPFAAYAAREPTRVVRLDQYASGYYDPGLPALISATAMAGRAVFGEQFTVSKRTVYQIIFGLCLAAGLVVLSPALPLPVSLGALVALGASILIPVLSWNAFTFPKWWEAYSTVLVGMLIVGLLTARPNRWRPWYFAGLTILASYSRLLRDEVVVTTFAALGGLVATLLALWLVARWWVKSPSVAETVWGQLRRCVLVGALFCLGLAAGPYLLRATIATAWGIPFGETTTAVHGAGHSLYLSLGYVPNPYAISWRDNVAMSHSRLIDPTVRLEDSRYQSVLRNEALRIMVESPWLVWTNVIKKTQNTSRWLRTSAGVRRAGYVAAFATAFSLAVLLWWRRPRLLALWGGLLGVGAGASAPALMIHPVYSFGILAFVMLVAFVAPPAVLFALRSETAPGAAHAAPDLVDHSKRVTAWAIVLLGIAALAIGASAWGWHAIRASRYADERAAVARSQDPLADLERDGYRYARYFNDLPANEQERLIAAMSATNDPRVAVPVTPATVNAFRPALVVYTSRQLHVIAWLGKEREVAKLSPESTHVFVGYCAACEHIPEQLPNDPYSLTDAHIRLDAAGIHNRSWNDGYQLLSIPVDTAVPPTGEVLLALQYLAPDKVIAFTLDLKTEGTWRVRFR